MPFLDKPSMSLSRQSWDKFRHVLALPGKPDHHLKNDVDILLVAYNSLGNCSPQFNSGIALSLILVAITVLY